MNKKDKQDFYDLFGESFREVVLPELEKIDNRLDVIESDLKGVKMTTESLDRKSEAQQTRLDRHGKNIETLKHKFVTA
ncbi:MAG: hypothetical protein AAB535_00190 [Patescibacteria group bacterium]